MTDHTHLSRRSLLQMMGASVAMGASSSFFPIMPNKAYAADIERNKILVLLKMNGANDTLNTIVPYTDPKYFTLRPTIALGRTGTSEFCWHDDVFGFHPGLSALLPAWADGKGDLALGLGVGYPTPQIPIKDLYPVQSHFKSSDILNTGVISEVTPDDGWLSCFFSKMAEGQSVADSVVLGTYASSPVMGTTMRTIASPPGSGTLKAWNMATSTVDTEEYKWAYSVQQDIIRASSVFNNIPSKAGTYPSTSLGSTFKHMANIILATYGTANNIPVYVVSHSGYDTHTNQLVAQNTLLSDFAGALAAFRTDMINKGVWQDVMIVTYSDFGRSAYENGVGGTDHGQANTSFIMGGSINGGYVATKPVEQVYSLANVANYQGRSAPGYSLDYRSLYATVMQGWFGASLSVSNSVFNRAALKGQSDSFASLPIFKA